MGSFCCSKQPINYQQHARKIKEKYRFKHFIGEGSFGKVQLIQRKSNQQRYAMKIFDKIKAFNQKCVKQIIRERKIVEQNQNQFLIKLVEAFQDKEKLYLVMNYMPYGSLRNLMTGRKRFSEEQTKFIIICILIGLQYLRTHNIIHRDIKPQNILIDSQQYFRIGDFSSSNYLGKLKEGRRLGTNGYMSPEMMKRGVQDFTTDYYSLGIITKELILGNKKLPLPDQQKPKAFELQNEQSEITPECIDFIRQMTLENSEMRIGKISLSQIWTHPWLKMNTLKKGQFLLKKNEINPFKDQKFRTISQISRNKLISTEKSDEMIANMLLLQSDNIQKLFTGYEYFQEEIQERAG